MKLESHCLSVVEILDCDQGCVGERAVFQETVRFVLDGLRKCFRIVHCTADCDRAQVVLPSVLAFTNVRDAVTSVRDEVIARDFRKCRTGLRRKEYVNNRDVVFRLNHFVADCIKRLIHQALRELLANVYKVRNKVFYAHALNSFFHAFFDKNRCKDACKPGQKFRFFASLSCELISLFADSIFSQFGEVFTCFFKGAVTQVRDLMHSASVFSLSSQHRPFTLENTMQTKEHYGNFIQRNH